MGVPSPDGNTKSRSERGHRSLHFRSSCTTMPGSGIVRNPEADFGGPITLRLSARCRTVRVDERKSTLLHGRPRSSDARSPANIATKANGKSIGAELSRAVMMMARKSAFPGMSGRSRRRDGRFTLTPRQTFFATRPRRSASEISIERDLRARSAIARERVLSSVSRNSSINGFVSWFSRLPPISGTMCSRTCCSYEAIVVGSRSFSRAASIQSAPACLTVTLCESGVCVPLLTS